MLVDREVIEARLKYLEDTIRKLYAISAVELEEFLSRDDLQDRAERNLQVAIQCCIDIGNHTIAATGLRAPNDYGDIFRILDENQIIGHDLAETFVKMAGFRNILVHVYISIDLRRVHQGINMLSDFEEFAKAIVAWLQKAQN